MSADVASARARFWTAYQIWAIGLLFLISISNFIDRSVISILQEQIKHDLKLRDWQLGLVSGPAFSLLYVTAGLPIARWAERGRRVSILSLAIAVWSGMSAACGLVQGFAQLALCRMGVAMGEAGCTPVSHSIFSDVFPARQRGMAMSIFMTSLPIGTAAGAMIGGLAAAHWGWRAAFFIVGAPGVLLAVLTRLTFAEPPRGAFDSEAARATPPGRFWPDFKELMRVPAFAHIAAASAMFGAAGGGVLLFIPGFLQRQFSLPLPTVGAIMVYATGAAGIVGTVIGGWVADRYSRWSVRSYIIVSLVGAVGTAVLYIIAFLSGEWRLAAGLIIAAGVFSNLKNGPIYAVVQNMVPTRMRATASATILISIVAIGGTVGPMVVGVISDVLAGHVFPASLGAFAHVCPGGRAAAGAAPALAGACQSASAAGLEGGLVVVSLFYVWSGLHYAFATRSIQELAPDEA